MRTILIQVAVLFMLLHTASADVLSRLAVGRWQIFHGDGTPIYVTLYPDHRARSSWGEGETGRWSVVNGNLLMTWSDGWRDVITTEQGRFRKAGYAPGNRDLAAPSNRTAAYKLDS
jgi:hypothetical protein